MEDENITIHHPDLTGVEDEFPELTGVGDELPKATGVAPQEITGVDSDLTPIGNEHNDTASNVSTTSTIINTEEDKFKLAK